MPDYQAGSPLWSRFLNSRQTPSQPEPQKGCTLPPQWEKRSYAAIDVETTGLESFRDRVIEIGVQLFSFDPEGALIEGESWSSLINPGIAIPASATAIHGITDLEISGSPFFSEIRETLDSLLGSRVAVAHNASFDIGFIDAEYRRIGLTSPFGEAADSLLLLRQASPNMLSYSLGKAAIILGIERGVSHRALDDAKTSMRIYAHCARILAGVCP